MLETLMFTIAVCINGMPPVCCSRFCGECLQPCLQAASPLCPLCRVPFDPKKVERSSGVEKQLASFKAPCRGCSKKVEGGVGSRLCWTDYSRGRVSVLR